MSVRYAISWGARRPVFSGVPAPPPYPERVNFALVPVSQPPDGFTQTVEPGYVPEFLSDFRVQDTFQDDMGVIHHVPHFLAFSARNPASVLLHRGTAFGLNRENVRLEAAFTWNIGHLSITPGFFARAFGPGVYVYGYFEWGTRTFHLGETGGAVQSKVISPSYFMPITIALEVSGSHATARLTDYDGRPLGSFKIPLLRSGAGSYGFFGAGQGSHYTVQGSLFGPKRGRWDARGNRRGSRSLLSMHGIEDSLERIKK